MVSLSLLLSEILPGRYESKIGRTYKLICARIRRDIPYFLADCISYIMKKKKTTRGNIPFVAPSCVTDSVDSAEEKNHSIRQEAIRMDMELFFSVLQARFRILRQEKCFSEIEHIVGGSKCFAIIDKKACPLEPEYHVPKRRLLERRHELTDFAIM